MEEQRHQVAFEPLASCRHVEGVGAGEHEAVAARGVVQDQLLRDGAALGVAEHGGGVDTQMDEQAHQVSCELRSRIRGRQPPTAPVAAQVGNDHAMPGRELPDYWLEHLAGDHQPVHQQERGPRSALGEVEEL